MNLVFSLATSSGEGVNALMQRMIGSRSFDISLNKGIETGDRFLKISLNC